MTPAPTPEPSRHRLRATERRELILAAGLEEFARDGYDAASMGRIGAAAGISRTVLYDHFPSKRALFGQLLAETHARLLSHLRETLTAAAPMRERIEATIDAYLGFAEREPLAWQVLFPGHPPVDPDVAADHRRCRTESNRLFARMLAPDAERTGLDPASPRGQMVFAVHQAALRELVHWWQSRPEVERDEVVGAAMDALWVGLGGIEAGEVVVRL